MSEVMRRSPLLSTCVGVCAAMLTLAPLALAGPGKRVFNVVTDFCAKGDGVTDDHAAIQAALNAAKVAANRAAGAPSPQGAVVYFPEGVYRVTKTLELNFSAGIEIAGAGVPSALDIRQPGFTAPYAAPGTVTCPVPFNPLIHVNGPATAIIADFSVANSGPLFRFVGQVGHHMRDMALYGCPLNSPNRANCTALVQTGSLVPECWGNSNNKYSNLYLADAVQGIKLGQVSQECTNSEVIFERIYALGVDTVFQTQTIQSLNLVFRLIGGVFCKTVFDFDNSFNSGGAVSADTITLTDCGGTGPDDWIIKVAGQPNTGMFRFNSIFIETNSEQLLRSRGWGVAHLSNVLDARAYKTSRPALIKVEGGTVAVYASELVPNSSGGAIGFAPVVEFVNTAGFNRTIRLRDCILPAARPTNGGTGYLGNVIAGHPFIAPNSYFRVNTCDDPGSTPLPDATSAGSW